MFTRNELERSAAAIDPAQVYVGCWRTVRSGHALAPVVPKPHFHELGRTIGSSTGPQSRGLTVRTAAKIQLPS